MKGFLRGTLTTVVKRSSTVVLKGACQWVMDMASSISWGKPFSRTSLRLHCLVYVQKGEHNSPRRLLHRVHVCLEREDGPGELLLLHGVALQVHLTTHGALAAAALDLDQVDAQRQRAEEGVPVPCHSQN